MKAMPDLARICKKFRKSIGTLEDVVRVYQVVLKVNAHFCVIYRFLLIFIQLPGIKESLESLESELNDDISPLNTTFTKPISVREFLLDCNHH